MLAGNNKLSREEFVNQIGHPRKIEMANMIFDGASFEVLQEAGFARVNVLEMTSKIKVYVEGMGDFKVGSEVVETESGPSNSGSSESGPSDSGSSESGPSESGPSESGPSDSGSSESEVITPA